MEAHNPTVLLRWHISRIYEDIKPSEESDKFTYVEVTVEQSRRPLDIKNIGSNESDDLKVWKSDEREQVMGFTTENSFLRVLKYALDPQDESTNFSDSRRLTEDMVLVQSVIDDDSFRSAWSEQVSRDKIQPIDWLLELSEAEWIDFTKQARKLSKELYRKALEKSINPSDEAK